MNGAGVLVALVVYALIAYGLYWLIRLGVRHGIQDADRRRPAPPAAGPVGPPEDPAD